MTMHLTSCNFKDTDGTEGKLTMCKQEVERCESTTEAFEVDCPDCKQTLTYEFALEDAEERERGINPADYVIEHPAPSDDTPRLASTEATNAPKAK